ncbi:hypothetical protein K490DRAFT_71097 [Saccharata proteae CBS 121410]|uniref:Uncharacterized protein n=1 Tax=Saccharata proteae CBS 121410 TaxID=1314787 RepID=A0A9P4I0Y5_9PEZI|nr:hypothetical protein K490DRAFT_71097 [Saccharata proteae CBS 121410]
MHDEHPHPLLAQIPLTVSPFVSLPTATPLPYTYKSLPSTLPPSITDTPPSNSSAPDPSNPTAGPPKASYVTSASGHAAHPDDIIASCRALQQHLAHMEQEARGVVDRWNDSIRERELAEKRRVAPGWLDQEVKMLVPERQGQGQERPGDEDLLSGDEVMQMETDAVTNREGEELDRAFGGLGLR